MEELRLSAVATRVVAWHNRHPLARRITAAQVHAIGYVALPFAGPHAAAGGPAGDAVEVAAEPPQPGGTLRERAQARARQSSAAGAPEGVPTVTQLAVDPKQLVADFSENFIDPLTPRQVERFARRHGQALVRAPADGPLRRVRADGRQPDGGGLTLYLLTAVIETGTRKSRVLLGGGNTPAVMGRRVLARGRVMAGFVPLLALGAGVTLSLRPLPLGSVLAVAPAASAASAAARPALAHAASAASPASTSAAASAPTVALDAHAPAAGASAPVAVAAHGPAPAASAPLDVEPRLGRIDMPSIKPHLDPKSQAAARVAEAASAAAREAVAHAPPAPHAPAAPAAPVKVAAAPPPAVGAFALSTRLLRTRAEADQVRVAMRSLLKAIDAGPVHVDVMPEGEDWRVVGMPFASRGDADKARALLVSRGMRVEVVSF